MTQVKPDLHLSSPHSTARRIDLGVFCTGDAWPDLVVGEVMAALELTAAHSVVTQAWAELQPLPVRA